MKRMLMALLALVLVVTSLAAFAEEENAVAGIFAKLTAEDSKYTAGKTLYTEYYPGIQYEEKLENDSITITVSGNEYMEGSWTFVKDGDYLTLTVSGDDFNGLGFAMYLLNAIGEYYEMNTSLLSSYINGLSAMGMESPYYLQELDEAANTVKISLYMAGPYDMKELDQMIVNEDLLNMYDYEPLTEDYVSRSISLGKLLVLVNGNKDNANMLLAEYGDLDNVCYQSAIEIAKALQPAGWEAFVADYSELKDAETAEYKASVNVDEATVREFMDEIMEGYSYALIRFGK